MAKRKRTVRDERALVRQVIEATLAHKALQVVALDVRERSSYADYLVIASGTSDRHVQAIAEGVAEALRTGPHRPIGTEGLREGQWALLDYGSVVLHVFHSYTRDVYRLEELWRDAPRLAVEPEAVPVARRR